MTTKTPEPMDAGAPERDNAEPVANNPRACYAAKQLVKEVLNLFPETEYGFTSYTPRNVALVVWFAAKDDGEETELDQLLRLVDADPRVEKITYDDNEHLAVVFHNRPRTQDLRDPFGLDEALMVLADEDTGDGGDAFYTSDDEKDGGGA